MIAQSQEIYISESVHEALDAAAAELQIHYVTESGTVYRADDLKAALVKWMESSIEQLAEDAIFHVKSGQPVAFNPDKFDRALAQTQPIEVPEAVAT